MIFPISFKRVPTHTGWVETPISLLLVRRTVPQPLRCYLLTQPRSRKGRELTSPATSLRYEPCFPSRRTQEGNPEVTRCFHCSALGFPPSNKSIRSSLALAPVTPPPSHSSPQCLHAGLFWSHKQEAAQQDPKEVPCPHPGTHNTENCRGQFTNKAKTK